MYQGRHRLVELLLTISLGSYHTVAPGSRRSQVMWPCRLFAISFQQSLNIQTKCDSTMKVACHIYDNLHSKGMDPLAKVSGMVR